MTDTMTHSLIIIGSGPAAHTAGIYASRADMAPLMFEGEYAGGVAAGGQLTTTTDVENFPGFPDGIMGPELMDAMRRQSLRCGTTIETKTVDRVDVSRRPFTVFGRFGEVHAHCLIIATGATAKRLGIDGEDTYWQKGVSACAVCDGGLPIFRNNPLIVIGGGDTAVEEACYLAKFGSHVTMLVRKGHLRASKVMQDRAIHHPKITILWHTEAEKIVGDDCMTGVHVRHNQTNDTQCLAARGLFYAIGHEPNTAFLDGQVTVDADGYIQTTPGTTHTSVDGIFACGDVQDKVYRQAVSAAGTGCMAALDAERYLTKQGLI